MSWRCLALQRSMHRDVPSAYGACAVPSTGLSFTSQAGLAHIALHLCLDRCCALSPERVICLQQCMVLSLSRALRSQQRGICEYTQLRAIRLSTTSKFGGRSDRKLRLLRPDCVRTRGKSSSVRSFPEGALFLWISLPATFILNFSVCPHTRALLEHEAPVQSVRWRARAQDGHDCVCRQPTHVQLA